MATERLWEVTGMGFVTDALTVLGNHFLMVVIGGLGEPAGK